MPPPVATAASADGGTYRLGVATQRFWGTPERVIAKLGVPLLAANGRQAEHVPATLPPA